MVEQTLPALAYDDPDPLLLQKTLHAWTPLRQGDGFNPKAGHLTRTYPRTLSENQ
jgi:hypothetical protein